MKKLLAALAFAGLSTGAFAQSEVTIKIGYGPGTGFDTAGRLVARHLGRFLPGNPSVEIQNVPGAGGLVLAKQMLRQGRDQDHVLGLINPFLISAPTLQPEAADFDPSKVSWMGALGDTPRVCLAGNNSGVATMAEFLSKEVVLGGSAKGSKFEIVASALRNGFNDKIQLVLGFQGLPEVMLAIERGEIDGVCGVTLSSFLTDDLSQTATAVGTFAPAIEVEGFSIPSFIQADTDALTVKAMELINLDDEVFSPLIMAPGTPPENVALYREAFAKMIKDPEFLADSAKVLPHNTATNWQGVEAVVNAVLTADPTVVERARELLR